jgi:hypothetical protein
MHTEIPDEFIELLERLAEGPLEDAGHERLIAMIRQNPELLEVARGQFEVSAALGLPMKKRSLNGPPHMSRRSPAKPTGSSPGG